MSIPVVVAIPVGLGAAALLGAWALSKNGQPDALTADKLNTARQAFTTKGPRGEDVFTPDLAQGLIRSLPGMQYTYVPTVRDRSLVQIAAEKSGARVAPNLSALNWVRAQNRTLSILAPFHAVMPTGAPKFLRAVAPGKEYSYAGYAVVLYAGSIERRVAPPGSPSLRPRVKPRLVPTHLAAAHDELPDDLASDFNQALAGSNPRALAKSAADLRRAGLTTSAAVLENKAGDLAAQGVTGPSAASLAARRAASDLGESMSRLVSSTPPAKASFRVAATPSPSQWTLPVKAVQTSLIKLGILSATSAQGKPNDDGLRGTETDRAVKTFQSNAGLEANGIVNLATAAALGKAFNEADHPAKSFLSNLFTSAPPSPKPGKVKTPPVLVTTGPTSRPAGWVADVRTVQTMLASLGLLPPTEITGILSPATVAFVKLFQRSHGLGVDGTVGSGTWPVLQAATADRSAAVASNSRGAGGSRAAVGAPMYPPTSVPFPFPTAAIWGGVRGNFPYGYGSLLTVPRGGYRFARWGERMRLF